MVVEVTAMVVVVRATVAMVAVREPRQPEPLAVGRLAGQVAAGRVADCQTHLARARRHRVRCT